ncbi:unnamed protein product [Porites evermanni]|uniref:Uncharacterized protein n=1 Tax=Porites evermanni TaxID=104178 RepID=A0ABN8LEB1_9CNID|nr:unnamed protein product [Porites evermanni]
MDDSKTPPPPPKSIPVSYNKLIDYFFNTQADTLPEKTKVLRINGIHFVRLTTTKVLRENIVGGVSLDGRLPSVPEDDDGGGGGGGDDDTDDYDDHDDDDDNDDDKDEDDEHNNNEGVKRGHE